MRNWIQALIAAVVGGALVWAMFWLVESLLYLPVEAGRLAILVGALGVAALARRRRLASAAFLTGAGFGWALHEVNPLMLCQSDSLYRLCTMSEVASMLVPIALLLTAAATLEIAAQLGKAKRAFRAR